MKQLVVAGVAFVASMVGASSFAAAPSSALHDVRADVASRYEAPATPLSLAQALAFDRDALLETPSLAKGKKPAILNDKCSFNGSRHLFRLHRTECRMV